MVSLGKNPINITIQRPKTKPNEFCQLKIYLLRLCIALFFLFLFPFPIITVIVWCTHFYPMDQTFHNNNNELMLFHDKNEGELQERNRDALENNTEDSGPQQKKMYIEKKN